MFNSKLYYDETKEILNSFSKTTSLTDVLYKIDAMYKIAIKDLDVLVEEYILNVFKIYTITSGYNVVKLDNMLDVLKYNEYVKNSEDILCSISKYFENNSSIIKYNNIYYKIAEIHFLKEDNYILFSEISKHDSGYAERLNNLLFSIELLSEITTKCIDAITTYHLPNNISIDTYKLIDYSSSDCKFIISRILNYNEYLFIDLINKDYIVINIDENQTIESEVNNAILNITSNDLFKKVSYNSSISELIKLATAKCLDCNSKYNLCKCYGGV